MRRLSPIVQRRALLLSLLQLIWLTQQLQAHRPVFTDDDATDPDTAIAITEPHISQVVYREISDRTPQIWLAFDVPKDFEPYIQIGVPVIDRLKAFRPSVAVVGPGLSRAKGPFKTPEKNGAEVFTTNKVSQPPVFHEHFTNTRSWVLRSQTISLPKPGHYYLVAYSEDGQNGKLWLSVGKKESFKAEHWWQFPTWRKLIRKFHEVK